MYLMASSMERARGLAALGAVRGAAKPETAHALVLDALPPVVSAVLVPSEVESIRQRLINLRDLPARARLNRSDYAAALGVFLLVFVSTFPVVIPFMVIRDVATALRVSNGIAAVMLFAAGWQLGHYAGRPGWRTGLGMVALGVALVAITVALGG
jgi:VIT1/CCC1 family predicted Fe2+/Mn2+ transporter